MLQHNHVTAQNSRLSINELLLIKTRGSSVPDIFFREQQGLISQHKQPYQSKLFSSSGNDSQNQKQDKGVEPKYIVALLVFLGACIYDKIVMHGGF